MDFPLALSVILKARKKRLICSVVLLSLGYCFLLIDETFEEIKSKDKVLIGDPVLTRYERARIVGARALQVSQGAPVLIDVEADDFRPIEVAKWELKARVLPVGMARRIPNGQYQIIPIQWLADREFISQIKIDPKSLMKKIKKEKNT